MQFFKQNIEFNNYSLNIYIQMCNFNIHKYKLIKHFTLNIKLYFDFIRIKIFILDPLLKYIAFNH